VKARPILMHARSINNLLAGRKTQTRRIMKPQPAYVSEATKGLIRCPYGGRGDLLWVRESICVGYGLGDGTVTAIPFDGCEKDRKSFYRATEPDKPDEAQRPWRPSIHMPRWASRLTLELTDVRAQRVREISVADILTEGVDCPRHGRGPCNDSCGELGELWRDLWDETNGAGAFDRDDYTWALSFIVHRRNVDEMLRQKEAA
jgi:hypothetical protein